jgi:hypothetical protein
MSKRLVLILFFAACGGGNDNPPPIDSPPAAQTITVTGTASELTAGGGTPVEGLLVQAFSNDDENTVVTSSTTAADGTYTLTITTNGVALDGFLKATKTGLVDTYLYPPAPLAADFDGASLNMVSQNTFDLLSNLCQGNQDPAMGTIAMLAQDAAGNDVAGVTFTSTPAASKVCYNGANGLPSGSATETAADGVGYLFNVTGDATVNAAADGQTFRSHPVEARAGALTTTLITP